MNLREGTRRLALLLGIVGIIAGGFFSYLFLQDALDQRARHNKFEQLADSGVSQKERKNQVGWVSIDPKTGERIPWNQQVDKGGIKTIHWTDANEIGSIETEDGQTLYPTPTPAAWEYLLVALFPIFGFFVPWGAIRAIGWVGAGFKESSK